MSSLIVVKANVTPATYGLLCAMAAFAAAVHESLANGFQPGDDIPDIIKAAIDNFVPALKNADKIAAEKHMNGFAEAMGLGIGKIIEAAEFGECGVSTLTN